MELPGSPKVHVWSGLVIALVGIALGGYAYTGDRAYHAVFILVAFLGFLMVVGGSVLTGWGQANRPRMGGKAARRKQEAKANEEQEDEDESPSIGQRLTGAVTGLTDRVREMRQGDAIVATVRCPDCGFVFEAEGEPPFEATCPECGYVDEVTTPAGGPPDREPAEVQGTPRTRPAPEAVDDEAMVAEPGPDGRRPGFAARIRDRLPKRSTGPAGTYTLACDDCGHAFDAEGEPPFEATCPECGHVGTVEAADA